MFPVMERARVGNVTARKAGGSNGVRGAKPALSGVEGAPRYTFFFRKPSLSPISAFLCALCVLCSEKLFRLPSQGQPK